jgi:hypothetical protein
MVGVFLRREFGKEDEERIRRVDYNLFTNKYFITKI